MSLSPGTRLGPYEILAPIGAGGMGEVWRARDTRLDRVVAIKKLKGEHSARFEQEARAIAALNHPHICQIHDVGADYIVMEYVEGSPLQGPLPQEDAIKLAIQIANALEEAHAKRILHRDLKPGNILVTKRGVAKLLDFGLAKLIADGDTTQTAAVSGTPAYMSPEQAEGKTLDERSDIFSFGAVLYELLSGRRAFESLAGVLRDRPAPLDGAGAEIAMRCLAKQPQDRFQTMAEVKAALERTSARDAVQQPSIAVLPFANMSGDKEQEYFSDGLSEEIINALAHIPGLKVTARTSAFAFRGKEQDVRRIAEALDVRTILEGSVRKAGNRIRVTAQLINAADGYHLWSERYDRELTDIFAVQDEIAATIAAVLKVKLTHSPASVRRYTPKFEAYEALLKGWHQFQRVSPEAFARGRKYLEDAIELDPKYAVPHAHLGAYYWSLANYGIQPAMDVMPHARAEVERALELDPSLQDARAVLALISAFYDYNWAEADRQLSLATTGESTLSPFAMAAASLVSLSTGRPVEALSYASRAKEQDPLNLLNRVVLALCLSVAGQDAQAIAELEEALKIGTDYTIYVNLTILYAQRHEYAKALEFAEKAYTLGSWDEIPRGLLAGVLMKTNQPDRANAVLAELAAGREYQAPLGFIFYHLICAELDKAAEWAHKAIEKRAPALVYFVLIPIAKDLRSSPYWPSIARELNLPATA